MRRFGFRTRSRARPDETGSALVLRREISDNGTGTSVALPAFMAQQERRISPRTPTRLRMTLTRGTLTLVGRCVELSHSGLLVELDAAADGGVWPYAAAKLSLPGGAIDLVTRQVARRGGRVALAIAAIEDADQQRLTDFLFERMLADAKKKRTRRAARLRLRAVA
jgi:hypothetical protein